MLLPTLDLMETLLVARFSAVLRGLEEGRPIWETGGRGILRVVVWGFDGATTGILEIGLDVDVMAVLLIVVTVKTLGLLGAGSAVADGSDELGGSAWCDLVAIELDLCVVEESRGDRFRITALGMES